MKQRPKIGKEKEKKLSTTASGGASTAPLGNRPKWIGTLNKPQVGTNLPRKHVLVDAFRLQHLEFASLGLSFCSGRTIGVPFEASSLDGTPENSVQVALQETKMHSKTGVVTALMSWFLPLKLRSDGRWI